MVYVDNERGMNFLTYDVFLRLEGWSVVLLLAVSMYLIKRLWLRVWFVICFCGIHITLVFLSTSDISSGVL